MSAIHTKTHSSAVYWFEIINGVLHVLLMQCHYKSGAPQWKPPAGGSKPDESPEDTAFREFREEAGDSEKGIDVERMVAVPRATISCPGKNQEGKGQHDKFWFLALEVSGTLRTAPKEETKSVLDPPEWVPVLEALGKAKDGHRAITARDHKRTLPLVVERYLDFNGTDPKKFKIVCDAVPGLLFL